MTCFSDSNSLDADLLAELGSRLRSKQYYEKEKNFRMKVVFMVGFNSPEGLDFDLGSLAILQDMRQSRLKYINYL